MTTIRHTIELDDTEAITLRAALALLQAESNLHIANKQAAPWTAYLRSIERIQTQLATGAQQTSGNTFWGRLRKRKIKHAKPVATVVAA